MDMKPPFAEKIKKELTAHGHIRIDNYYWLNEREDPKVLTYLQDENAYTKSVLEHTESFQKKIYDEIVGRIKKDDNSVPYKLRGYWYYTRFEKDQEYPIYCRKKESLEAAEEIILDVNKEAEGHAYYQIRGIAVSPNNDKIVFGEDTLGRRIYTLKFKDLTTGKISDEVIENTTGNVVWAQDNQTVFYSVQDEITLRSDKIKKHKSGQPPKNDPVVYHEPDATFSVFIQGTKSRKYLLISSHSTLSSEYRCLDADNPDGEFRIIQSREKELEYGVYHYEDQFYILTNWKAKNFRLMKTSVDHTKKENWKEVIPHRADVLLEEITNFNNYMIVSERKDALTRLRVIPRDGSPEHYIEMDEEVYSVGTGTNVDFDSKTLRFYYTSLTTPLSIYDYHLNDRSRKLLKQQEIVGEFNPDNYRTERHFAVSRDGTNVPISLVYRKDLKKKDGNPLLLYGYGSYGLSTDPSFGSARLSLLDRGFIFAIAHSRGGQEMGRQWYEDGKFFKKKNTFTDFIDCADYLIKKKYTDTNQLFALGGSAGGLLMGAVVNMRPELFKGIIAAVPFVDVVTTMLDDSIPLTTGEYEEWGNPNQKEYYDYMISYSPYDNVEAKKYPNMLITTGLHDSQVQYWEPAKWVAKLRDLKTDDNMLLLHTNIDTGHGGASGRFEYHKETALEYAFLFNLLGITA